MVIRIAAITLLLLFFSTIPVQAKYDPRLVPNNKFGIHIADVNDLSEVPSLINSNGGDWGYVTLVIGEDDRDQGKWQNIFDRMRRLHLIPIVRLATRVDGDAWIKPRPSDAKEWANFLNSLNWPIENRYVVIFNEPNHAKEWGRTINPEEYAQVLTEFAKGLKETSEDFFILPAGLDVSAVSDGSSMDATVFLRQMLTAKPEITELIDGWTSHSYPNPAFSGLASDWGRGTLRSYLWELGYLKNLGLTKNLPIFITETGWLHNQGVSFNPGLLPSETVAERLKLAATAVWFDPNVVAVTPFIFSYQGLPFDHFSWKKLGQNGLYPHAEAYRAIPKIAGQPQQRLAFELLEPILPQTLVASSSYNLKFTVKNIGQGILDPKEGDELTIKSDQAEFITVFDPLPYLEPGQSDTIGFHLKTPSRPETYSLLLIVRHYNEETVIAETQLTVVPPPSLTLQVPLGWRQRSNSTDATVLVYDHDQLLMKFTEVRLADGKATVTGLASIIPGKEYRIVILVPYYLPRQKIAKLEPTDTYAAIKRMLPLDFNRDGALSSSDLYALLKLQPNFIASLFFGQ